MSPPFKYSITVQTVSILDQYFLLECKKSKNQTIRVCPIVPEKILIGCEVFGSEEQNLHGIQNSNYFLSIFFVHICLN